MNEDLLRVEALGPVARLTLNRPQAMNAMNLALLGELDRCLGEVASNDELRVLVHHRQRSGVLRRCRSEGGAGRRQTARW